MWNVHPRLIISLRVVKDDWLGGGRDPRHRYAFPRKVDRVRFGWYSAITPAHRKQAIG